MGRCVFTVGSFVQRDQKGVLEAKWVLAELCLRHPAQFHERQARTLLRRFREWRVMHGPEPKVFFEQVAVPGRKAAIDFRHASHLAVTIAGASLPHLLFEFALSYSGWRWVTVAFGETFEALVAGLQGAVGSRRRAGCTATICPPRPSAPAGTGRRLHSRRRRCQARRRHEHAFSSKCICNSSAARSCD